MSDCSKCWQTPCECGWHFRRIPPANFAAYIAGITQHRSKAEAIGILKLAIKTIEQSKDFDENPN